jgi:hypothetical protein
MKNWKLLEFNEELGEIAAYAHGCGPQRVTVNGNIEIVVLSPEEYARLTGEPLVDPPTDSQTEAETGLSFFAAMRRPFEEAAARGEDVYWPWDWDWEKREWVAPADHAIPS